MIAYNLNRQKRLDIGPPIHEGGEGWICPIVGQPSKLAKIYKPQSQVGREMKLRWMIANAPNDPGRSIGHASIAWPEILLYDDHGKFSGYVMPRIVNARTLLQVFNPRLRAQSAMDCDGTFLHRAARNIAAAIGALHARDYIIGDLNESNILVTPKALVTVIDTDSFQAREENDGQIIFYPCPVGRPEYTPPELQGKRFKGEVRQPEQDAFALAVLIFQLLMGGNHPFRALWGGTGIVPPIEERIMLGLFPYDRSSAKGSVSPPPNLSLEVLSPPVADLMRRCFVEGHLNPKRRPLPAEWESALIDAEKSLITCPNKHVYAGHLKTCPQCGIKPLPKPPPQTTTITKPPPTGTPLPAAAPQIKVTFSPLPMTSPTPAARICPSCLRVVPGNLLFCPNCATAIDPKTCRHCGYLFVPNGAKCCPRCGRAP